MDERTRKLMSIMAEFKEYLRYTISIAKVKVTHHGDTLNAEQINTLMKSEHNTDFAHTVSELGEEAYCHYLPEAGKSFMCWHAGLAAFMRVPVSAAIQAEQDHLGRPVILFETGEDGEGYNVHYMLKVKADIGPDALVVAQNKRRSTPQ